MPMPSISFVSLGCPKNLVDSEKMLGLLAEAGCPIVGDGGLGDVMVVNTCGFLGASRDEALEILEEAAGHKRAGRIERIVVAGCLVQRDGRGLLKAVPEIDALVGVHNRQDIVRAVIGDSPRHRSAREGSMGVPPVHRGARKGSMGVPPVSTGHASDNTNDTPSRRALRRRSTAARGELASSRNDARPADSLLFLGEYHPSSWVEANKSDQARLRLTPSHYAYLRMSEGCNQKCTFCTIPSIRGPMHCKTVDEIMAEAGELIADGAVEINLIGQDTTSYGQDIAYEAGLSGLLRTLDGLDGVEWIRLMYAYPSDFTDEMIDAIAECERVAKYIDIPLQHISDRVLKAMYRRVTREQTEMLLANLRRRIPGVSIRTTLISGFPGETDAEHRELCEFIRDFGFDALGVFPYSNEPGTPAHRMKGHLPPEVIQERVEELMLTQQEVAFCKAASRAGQSLRVLIDDFGEAGVYPARHQGQAPDVDGLTYVRGGEFDAGEFATVRCTGSRDYDLLAEPANGALPILQYSS